jgi:hypothetical protein
MTEEDNEELAYKVYLNQCFNETARTKEAEVKNVKVLTKEMGKKVLIPEALIRGNFFL